jgi:hypothetical protein
MIGTLVRRIRQANDGRLARISVAVMLVILAWCWCALHRPQISAAHEHE